MHDSQADSHRNSPSRADLRRSGGTALRAIVAVCFVSILVTLLIWLPKLRATLRGKPLEHSEKSTTTVEPNEQSPTAPTPHHTPTATVAPPEPASKSSEIDWVKTISVLPESDYQLDAAHERSVKDSCEPLPQGQPLATTNFVPYLTQGDYRRYADKVPAMSNRQHIFSVGLDMLDSDKRRLPKLSSRQILKYMDENFIALQVRIQKEPISGELFLHHQPIAAVGNYRRRIMTKSPTEGMSQTLRNYRSLGLYLGSETPHQPSNLRTLVLLHKSQWDAGVGLSGGKTKYEFVFVRARAQSRSNSIQDLSELELHTFATSEQRTILHYLKGCDSPGRPQECSVKNLLHFTEYVDAGLRPVASSSRGSVFNQNRAIPIIELDQYAKSQGWKGRGLDNLNQLLDAIIDNQITSASPTPKP